MSCIVGAELSDISVIVIIIFYSTNDGMMPRPFLFAIQNFE